jgi:hypothetical protein
MSAYDAFMYDVPAMRQTDAAESARAAERFREKLANDEIIVGKLAAKEEEISRLRQQYDNLGRFSLRPSVRRQRKQLLALYNQRIMEYNNLRKGNELRKGLSEYSINNYPQKKQSGWFRWGGQLKRMHTKKNKSNKMNKSRKYKKHSKTNKRKH